MPKTVICFLMFDSISRLYLHVKTVVLQLKISKDVLIPLFSL